MSKDGILRKSAKQFKGKLVQGEWDSSHTFVQLIKQCRFGGNANGDRIDFD
jgi:hypothetical protein